jgi:hypothetical protein
MERMNDGTWHFEARTIQEIISAAGIAEDDSKVYITGKRLKELVPMLIQISSDIEKCHQILTDKGVPELNGGTQGLVGRLEFLDSF